MAIQKQHPLRAERFPRGSFFRKLATCYGAAFGCLLFLFSNSVTLGADQSSRHQSKGLLRIQYQKSDPRYCHAATCVDYDDDGQREILFASRETKELQMLTAADGTVRWAKKFAEEQQSISAFDLDGDAHFEILYSVSSGGRLYVLDTQGNVLRKWDTDDWKLGNSAVIIDADGDGVLEGFFGSRSRYLLRLRMDDLTVLDRREDWVQCGCHTTAMDVDHDGKWDLFAGSGDDTLRKGKLIRFDPISLDTIWSYDTNDNASSADPVLADIDNDGQVEIVKSVDNYGKDDAHDAIYAFETDGTLLWKVEGFSGEDSPNVADLDGDGAVEIVGMTFGCVVYCLDGKGKILWQKDLRPEYDDTAHVYMTPILCDVNGDAELEILALTNGGWTNKGHGIVVVLSADGEELDQLDVGDNRSWGEAFYANIDDDPFMELVVSGRGGMDVIETHGYGPATEHYQRRRNYQRLNTVPWAYADTYFLYRGKRQGVKHLTDNLVLAGEPSRPRSGRFVTELLTLPPNGYFDRLDFDVRTPEGTMVVVNLLDQQGAPLTTNVPSSAELHIDQPVHIEFHMTAKVPQVTPVLDAYRLSFDVAQ